MEFQKQIPTTENRARVIAKRFSWNIPYIKMLLAYAFIAFMVFFFGIAPNRQFSILALRWCVIAPICAYIIINRLELQKDIEYIILSFMLGSIMLSVISILAYSGCFPRLPWHFNIYALYGVRYEEYGAIDRLAAAYQIPIFGAMDIGGNLTVIFASFAIPLAVSLLLYTKRQRLKQLIALAALAFNLIVVIISASRSVWIGVFVSSILVVLLNKKILEFRTFAYLLLIGIVSVLTVVMLSKIGYISYEISERISELLEILKGRLGAYEYWKYQTGGRDITWREGLSVAIRYPFGTGFMESFAPAGGMDLGPHSQYLFLLLGTGITGAAVFFLFLVRCAYKCFTSCNIDNYTSSWIIKGAVAVVVCYLFDAIMIHTFLVAGVDILLLLICGAGVRLVELSRGKTSD